MPASGVTATGSIAKLSLTAQMGGSAPADAVLNFIAG